MAKPNNTFNENEVMAKPNNTFNENRVTTTAYTERRHDDKKTYTRSR